MEQTIISNKAPSGVFVLVLYSPRMCAAPDVDIDFEPEDEFGDIGSAKAKLAKLRDELAIVKKERDEYLDGWQRCKADTVNAKKEAQEALTRARAFGKESFVEELIPALDSFDMAMQGEAWGKVDPVWRSGVESIHAQLLSVLEAHGIRAFGAVGDAFNANLHEALQEAEGESGTIVRIIRRGYRAGDRILRPAQVVVGA